MSVCLSVCLCVCSPTGTYYLVINNDDTAIAAAAAVSCVNYPIATLFEHVDIYLNKDLVSNISNYSYKAYLEALLTFSEESKKGWLQGGVFYGHT